MISPIAVINGQVSEDVYKELVRGMIRIIVDGGLNRKVMLNTIIVGYGDYNIFRCLVGDILVDKNIWVSFVNDLGSNDITFGGDVENIKDMISDIAILTKSGNIYKGSWPKTVVDYIGHDRKYFYDLNENENKKELVSNLVRYIEKGKSDVIVGDDNGDIFSHVYSSFVVNKIYDVFYGFNHNFDFPSSFLDRIRDIIDGQNMMDNSKYFDMKMVIHRYFIDVVGIISSQKKIEYIWTENKEGNVVMYRQDKSIFENILKKLPVCIVENGGNRYNKSLYDLIIHDTPLKLHLGVVNKPFRLDANGGDLRFEKYINTYTPLKYAPYEGDNIFIGCVGRLYEYFLKTNFIGIEYDESIIVDMEYISHIFISIYDLDIDSFVDFMDGVRMVIFHIFYVLCDGKKDKIKWFSNFILRNLVEPGNKAPVMLFIKSAPGAGKSCLFEYLGSKIFGDKMYITDQMTSQLAGFNSSLRGRLMIVAEEFGWSEKVVNLLKQFITAHKYSFNEKNVPVAEDYQPAMCVGLTNKVNDLVFNMDSRSRRWVHFTVNNNFIGTVKSRKDYFRRLVDNGLKVDGVLKAALDIMFCRHYEYDFDLTVFPESATDALNQQVAVTKLHPIDEYIVNCICSIDNEIRTDAVSDYKNIVVDNLPCLFLDIFIAGKDCSKTYKIRIDPPKRINKWYLWQPLDHIKPLIISKFSQGEKKIADTMNRFFNTTSVFYFNTSGGCIDSFPFVKWPSYLDAYILLFKKFDGVDYGAPLLSDIFVPLNMTVNYSGRTIYRTIDSFTWPILCHMYKIWLKYSGDIDDELYVRQSYINFIVECYPMVDLRMQNAIDLDANNDTVSALEICNFFSHENPADVLNMAKLDGLVGFNEFMNPILDRNNIEILEEERAPYQIEDLNIKNVDIKGNFMGKYIPMPSHSDFDLVGNRIIGRKRRASEIVRDIKRNKRF